MSITPKMINEQGFEHALRGYDVKQVDDFLEYVAHEVGSMIETNYKLKEELEAAKGELQNAQDAQGDSEEVVALQNRLEAAEAELEALKAEATATKEADPVELMEAKAKIAELEQKLSDKEVNDDVISKAFISAQRSADALKEDARAEGERIYRESEAKARELLRDALAEKKRVLDEADSIKGSYEKFREEFKMLIAHFSEEAEKSFDGMDTPDVSDAAVENLLIKTQEAENIAAANENVSAQEEVQAKPAYEQQVVPSTSVMNDSFFDDIEEIS